jgi:hypothetical protein
VEWLVWANLVAHSRDVVHLFLPLDDRGVDGILRRPADDAMVPLQVKGRTKRTDHRSDLDVQIPDWSLHDAPVQWIVAVLDPQIPALAPNALLLDTASILRFATPAIDSRGEQIHRIISPIPPRAGSVWEPFACATDLLADRLLPPLSLDTPAVVDEFDRPPTKTAIAMHWMGALAEVEVMRLLSAMPELNVFKSFPDVELSEYVVRRSVDGFMRGIQVKCVGLEGPDDSGVFMMPARDLVWPTTALVVVLGWRRDLRAFDPQALLFPSSRMTELGYRTEDRWMGVFSTRPKRSSRFAEVTVLREDVGSLVLAAP